jgi:hypothetical protein
MFTFEQIETTDIPQNIDPQTTFFEQTGAKDIRPSSCVLRRREKEPSILRENVP